MLHKTFTEVACVAIISTIAAAQAQAYEICYQDGQYQIACDSSHLSRWSDNEYSHADAEKFCAGRGSSISTNPKTSKNLKVVAPVQRGQRVAPQGAKEMR